MDPTGPGERASPRADRCYRHADREAHISCQRCERRICPDCMRDASVGFQCPECIEQGRRNVRSARTLAGGVLPERPGRVSMVVIGLNVAVFVLTGLLQLDDLSRQGAMLPTSAIDPTTGTLLRGVDDGAYWRLLTSAFLHAGVLHLLLNMYALYLFGPFAEQALGTRRFIAAYVTMAVVASVFVYWLSEPRSITVGASGAVFGLFGLALVLLLRSGRDVRMLLVLLAINAVISTQGNISWQGHLGGFVAGLVIGLAIALPSRERRALVQAVVFSALWVAVVGAVVLRTAVLA